MECRQRRIGWRHPNQSCQWPAPTCTNGYFDLTTASLSYNLRLNDHWRLAARTAFDDRDFSAQNYYTTFASDTATERVKTWWNHVQAVYSKNNLNWQTHIGYKSTDDRYAFNSGAAPNQNNSSVLQLLSTANVELGKKSSFTAGLQHINRGIESNDRGNHEVWQSAFFGVWHQVLAEGLVIDPAIRLDYHELGGFEFVPQLSLSYRRSFFQLRGMAGKTIRDADFTERFNNYNRAVVPSGRIGNPDLEAESSFSYEAGADLWFCKNWKLSTTYFSRLQNELIDWIPTPYADMPRKDNLVPNGSYALAKNIAEVTTRGWEADLYFQKDFSGRHGINAAAGLVVINSDANGAEPGFYLSSHAKLLTNFSISYRYRFLSLSANGLYKSRNEQKAAPINAEITPDYFVLNARLEALLGKGISVYVQADNVFDESYSDLLGSPMPGRWLMGGVKFNFLK
jgi:iron complex outermembrane receptor protein